MHVSRCSCCFVEYFWSWVSLLLRFVSQSMCMCFISNIIVRVYGIWQLFNRKNIYIYIPGNEFSSRQKREITAGRVSVFPKYSKSDVALVLGTVVAIIILFCLCFLMILCCVYHNEKREELLQNKLRRKYPPRPVCCAFHTEKWDSTSALERKQYPPPYPKGTIFMVKNVETGKGKFLTPMVHNEVETLREKHHQIELKKSISQESTDSEQETNSSKSGDTEEDYEEDDEEEDEIEYNTM